MKSVRSSFLFALFAVALLFFLQNFSCRSLDLQIRKHLVLKYIEKAGGLFKIEKEVDLILSSLPPQSNKYTFCLNANTYPASSILSISDRAYVDYEYKNIPKHIRLALGNHFTLYYIYIFQSTELTSKISNSDLPLTQITNNIYLLE